MAARITSDVLESYLKCHYKAHLKLAGQSGVATDYGRLLVSLRQTVTGNAINKILALSAVGDVVQDIGLTTAALREGPLFILDPNLDDDLLSIRFDGLKRVAGPSELGDFHYIPILFYEGTRVHKEQRMLLETYALVLSRLQGRHPDKGVIWHGRDCKTTTIRLNLDLRKTERVFREVKELATSASPPRLILNNHCQACEFRQTCSDEAERTNDLSLLRGIGEKEIKRYAKKGIFSVTQLAHTFRPKRGRRASTSNHRYHALQALAVRDRRVYVLGTPQLRDAPVRVFLDIEGNPEERFDYLVGMIIIQDNEEKRFSFWADTRDQEEQIFEQLLEVITSYQDFLVFTYGGYEGAFVKRMLSRAKRKEPAERVLKNVVNILSIIYSHVYFPTYSNGLKDVAALLGSTWTAPDATGLQTLVWRTQWESTRADEWKQELITYNWEDCEALRRVTEFIYARCARPESPSASQQRDCTGPSVASVEEIDRLGTVTKRGGKEFFHADFDYVNSCAHFDYQRQHVYVRLGRSRRKQKEKNPRKYRNKTLRVGHCVEITSRKCPSCGSAAIDRPSKAHFGKGCFTKGKRTFDLVFTSGGIKRKVIDCRASVHECLKCGHVFIPERYQRLAKHFHGLMSWTMYEHIAHRIGCPIVSDMLKDFFGLTVHQAEIWRFRSMMARYYESCCKNMLKKMICGRILQVDETEVKLRRAKAYVWVFTTPEYVVYMHRPSREGGFLEDVLKEFRGVLVSDFYAAYDSLKCRQQKCLIHLMRDMNQELLNNPFDQELQSITSPFGTLLREIVVTIDEHGLKHWYLRKHRQSVTRFFRSLAAQMYRSETAESLRARLLKYQNRLFTFIEYDGVPWNNNNSENAIRRFAYYRDGTPGLLTEAGLKEYLVLLSLCQTCHYRGVSFLRFLLSREKDIDAFCQRPRRRALPNIEVYPKGVVRPDFGGRQRK